MGAVGRRPDPPPLGGVRRRSAHAEREMFVCVCVPYILSLMVGSDLPGPLRGRQGRLLKAVRTLRRLCTVLTQLDWRVMSDLEGGRSNRWHSFVQNRHMHLSPF